MLYSKIYAAILGTFAIILTVSMVHILVVLSRPRKLNSGCKIDPLESPLKPLPILAKSTHFLYPTWPEKEISFISDQPVDFICPGGQSISIGTTINKKTGLLSGTCSFGEKFLINGKEVFWGDMKCSGSSVPRVRKTGKRCAENGTELEIGFELVDGRILRTLLVCFNEELQIAHYSYIYQTASINKRSNSSRNDDWQQGSDIYTIKDVYNLYKIKQQRAVINNLLGLPAKSTQYIKDKNDFFSRGHLTANADNFYQAQQNASFFMQNAAPQWEAINKKSWNQIEKDVRNYGAVDLHVWTGVHGVTTLPHVNTSKPVELYLFVNESTKALPVPEIFWKLVQHPVTRKGVVLIGVNNPHSQSIPHICKDVLKEVTWVKCNSSKANGLCYACSISSFAKVVRSLPNITDGGLLLSGDGGVNSANSFHIHVVLVLFALFFIIF